jgi:hypothetical protein
MAATDTAAITPARNPDLSKYFTVLPVHCGCQSYAQREMIDKSCRLMSIEQEIMSSGVMNPGILKRQICRQSVKRPQKRKTAVLMQLGLGLVGFQNRRAP